MTYPSLGPPPRDRRRPGCHKTPDSPATSINALEVPQADSCIVPLADTTEIERSPALRSGHGPFLPLADRLQVYHSRNDGDARHDEATG
jgi:hypothetical protein